MEFNVSAAARLYGKQRKQLYRHMASGRLAYRVQGDGHRVIDLSELIRVYGEPTSPIPGNDTESTHSDPPSDTAVWHAMLDELRALREEVRDMKQQMLRLPAPAAQPPDPSENLPEGEQPEDDPHGFRSLVRAMRESDQ